MREIVIKEEDGRRRLDRFLLQYLNGAPKGFVYKMLRKKNITLNGRKAQGGELLSAGDVVTLFLAEATVESFTRPRTVNERAGRLAVVFEDAHVLLCDKPWGLLTHAGKPEDADTLAERLLLYLWKNGDFDSEVGGFTPAPVNRLDRNTTGLVLCAKTPAAAIWLSEAFAEGGVEKRYKALVVGSVTEPGRLRGVYEKDERTNVARVLAENGENTDARFAETLYEPVWSKDGFTLLDVMPLTGRSHQIRVQLAAAGYPIVGDAKYGDAAVNALFRRTAGVRSQLLHAESLTIRKTGGTLAYLTGRTFRAKLPNVFERAMENL